MVLVLTGAAVPWKVWKVLTGCCSGARVGKGLGGALEVVGLLVVVLVVLLVVGLLVVVLLVVVEALGVVICNRLVLSVSKLFSFKLKPKLVALSPVPNLVNENETVLPGILGIILLSASFRSMMRESLISWSKSEFSWFPDGPSDGCTNLT